MNKKAMAMSMTESIQLVVGIVGDKRLTRNDVIKILKETHDVSVGTVNRWLLMARTNGLLDRKRTSKRTGIEYEWFKADKGLVENDQERYSILAVCPGCGEPKDIAFEGDAQALYLLYSKLSWDCANCRDYVRLHDCWMFAALLKEFRCSVDSRRSDLDLGLTSVSVGRL